jgi:putative Mn2+ efflux pump MntP
LHLVQILLLSLALSADAFTVGTTIGVRHRTGHQLFRLAFHFGLFQSLLALAGALAGTLFASYMADYDHWVAFGLLVLVGMHMIWAARGEDQKQFENVDLTRGFSLVGLSLAVSIDAAGVGLPSVSTSLTLAIVLIGLTASAATLIAMLLAGKVADRVGKHLEISGGLVLIGLGAWTLITHLMV